MDHSHRISMFDENTYGHMMTRPNLYQKCSRGSHSSDTSSAYSGSDTMASTHSELDNDELDLTGLVESIVDSDEDDDLAESMDVSKSSKIINIQTQLIFPTIELDRTG